MSNGVSVTIEGGEELLRLLRDMPGNVEDVLEAAVMAVAEPIIAAADGLAPAPDILAETTKKTRQTVEVEVGPPAEKWYWRYFETGAVAHEITGGPLVFEGATGVVMTGKVNHTGMAASPFLRPAFDAEGTEEKANTRAGDVFREAVE